MGRQPCARDVRLWRRGEGCRLVGDAVLELVDNATVLDSLKMVRPDGDRVAAGDHWAKPVKVLRFEQIQEAHRLSDSGKAGGKMVSGSERHTLSY